MALLGSLFEGQRSHRQEWSLQWHSKDSDSWWNEEFGAAWTTLHCGKRSQWMFWADWLSQFRRHDFCTPPFCNRAMTGWLKPCRRPSSWTGWFWIFVPFHLVAPLEWQLQRPRRQDHARQSADQPTIRRVWRQSEMARASLSSLGLPHLCFCWRAKTVDSEHRSVYCKHANKIEITEIPVKCAARINEIEND